MNEDAKPPDSDNLKTLRQAAKKCLVCGFAKHSTQTVFGEGSERPLLMIVGEVPGDVEDKLGHPFVGPAGKLLHVILAELGIDPQKIYLTNAVKHFKFVQRGKRRLHQKPNSSDIRACHPWLTKEIESLNPKVLMALGSTAAAALVDGHVTIQASRSHWLKSRVNEVPMLVSWHPSAILRSPDPSARKIKRKQLKADLAKAWKKAKEP